MFVEILHPQGDPFAEPQVLAMDHLAKSGVLKKLADKLTELQTEFKITLAKAALQTVTQSELAEKQNKLKQFVHRLLLLWTMVARFCSDVLTSSFPSSQLASLINSVLAVIDPHCRDKHLQVDYVKFLKLLLVASDESSSTAFMQADHFLTVIAKTAGKDNLLASQVAAVFAEMKKLHCFKLHHQFVETHAAFLEPLALKSSSLASLLNHNKKARNGLRKNSLMDEGKASAKASDLGSERLEISGGGSPKTPKLNDSPNVNSLESMVLEKPPWDLDDHSDAIKDLKNLLNRMKHSSDDENDHDHEIFPGIGNPIRNFVQSSIKAKSPERQELHHEMSNEENSKHQEDKKSTITIEFGFSLGKKNLDDDDSDDEEFCDEGSIPKKRSATTN